MGNGIRKEYYISTLFGSITNSSEIWLVDIGASRHMTSYRTTLIDLSERDYSIHVELGDNAKYEVKDVGSTSFRLDSGCILHMSDILFVP